MIKHSESTQSNKSAISLQYIKKEVSHQFYTCIYIYIYIYIHTHKIRSKILVGKTTHSCGVMAHSTKEARQQKKQVVWAKLKKGRFSNAVGCFYKLGRLGTPCELWELHMSGKASLTC